ncbi:MAG: hypothetical protein GY745_00125 [Actinomycetia bacterium]|nr:hypothetical protein [Actinomycetes bacterium]
MSIFSTRSAIFAFTITLLAITGLAQPAGAQDEGAVADALARNGYYVETGSDVDANQLSDLVDELSDDDITNVGFVSLDADPLSDLTDFAEDVTGQVAGRGGIDTIVVVTPDSVGAFSTPLTDSRVQEALSGTEALSTIDIFEHFARSTGADLTTSGDNSTTQTTSPVATNTSSGGGGGSVLLILLLAAAAGVGLWLFMRHRHKKAELVDEIEQDRAEIQAQLATSADLVLKLADQVTLADAQTQTMFEEASRTFQAVSTQLGAANTAQQIDALDDQIDVAEWQLQTVDARVSGRPEPEDPRVAQQREADAQAREEERAELERRRASQEREAETQADRRRREQEQRRAELERRESQRPSRGGGGALGGLGGSVLGGVLGGILTGGRGGSQTRTTSGRQATTPTPSSRTVGNRDRDGFSRRTQRRRTTGGGTPTRGGRGQVSRRPAGGRGSVRRRK